MLEQCGEHPTAIAAVNDSVAFGAMEAIQAAGLSVPDDISVIGIDGHPLCGYATPRLTTFTYDFRTMFRSLIHTIATIVDGNVPTLDLHQVFSGAFTERESCAPPKPNITPEG
jgi:LacI family transcriptional regulator